MMLPSAAPVILLVLTRAARGSARHASSAAFIGGYLLAWTVFSTPGDANLMRSRTVSSSLCGRKRVECVSSRSAAPVSTMSVSSSQCPVE